jgi:hypothetical protein
MLRRITLSAYVDDHLVGSGKISQAAIVGQGGGVWATSSGLAVGCCFALKTVIE